MTFRLVLAGLAAGALLAAPALAQQGAAAPAAPQLNPQQQAQLQQQINQSRSQWEKSRYDYYQAQRHATLMRQNVQKAEQAESQARANYEQNATLLMNSLFAATGRAPVQPIAATTPPNPAAGTPPAGNAQRPNAPAAPPPPWPTGSAPR